MTTRSEIRRACRRRETIEEFLIDFSTREPNSGCWLWIGSLKENGYGAANFHRTNGYAHRRSYEAFVGPIPSGLFVCHRCDVRCCINPDHLFLGTQTDNMRDAKRKGRTAERDRHPMAKLTWLQVREMRRLFSAGWKLQETADAFGVSLGTAHLIRAARIWREESANV